MVAMSASKTGLQFLREHPPPRVRDHHNRTTSNVPTCASSSWRTPPLLPCASARGRVPHGVGRRCACSPQPLGGQHKVPWSMKRALMRKRPVEISTTSTQVGIITLKNRMLGPLARLFIECAREVSERAARKA